MLMNIVYFVHLLLVRDHRQPILLPLPSRKGEPWHRQHQLGAAFECTGRCRCTVGNVEQDCFGGSPKCGRLERSKRYSNCE